MTEMENKVNYAIVKESNKNETDIQMILSISKDDKGNTSLEKCLDKECYEALTSHNKIEVVEINVPSSQALRNFSLKLMQIKARLESGGEIIE